MSKRNQPRRQRARATNSIDRRQSGQGTPQYDFNQAQVPGFHWMSPLAQDQFAVQLFQTDWSAQKIVQIPVDDMLRDGWELQGLTDDQLLRMDAANGELGTLDVLRRAMRLERLVGGALIYLGAADGTDNPREPLDLARVQRDGLRFLNVLPRSRVSRTVWNQDPLAPGYGRPEYYWVNGVEVHRSRFVIFDGDPLLPVPDYTIQPTGYERNDGFGMSVLMSVYDDLTRATGSRQAAYQLLQRASVFLATADLDSLNGTEGESTAVQALRDVVNQINIYRGAVIHKDPSDPNSPITTIAAQFGSVPELLMSYLQVLSAASDIPATRFLGQAPGGLNATGEGDLENYYGRLESARTQRLKPKLMRLQKLVAISTLGLVPDGFDVTFEPLWSLSEAEEADVRAKDIANVVALQDAYLITDAEAVAELNGRGVTLGSLSGDAAAERPEPPAISLPLAGTTTPEDAAAQLAGGEDQ